MNSEGKQLFVPKALCLLSHQPMFSAFAVFLPGNNGSLSLHKVSCTEIQLQ